MERSVIRIVVEESDMARTIDVHSEGTAAHILKAAARLIALTELQLPEEIRATFRADFLQELNRARREVEKEIENR